MLRRERAVKAPAGVLRAWRARGHGDGWRGRPSCAELARERHGEAAARAYLAGWRSGARDRARHDAQGVSAA